VILADTSAWVEYDRATGSTADQRIAELISTDGALMFTEPVLMEVMAGARNDARAEDLRNMLLRFGLAHFDAVTDFDAAAKIYRRCRQVGITPRGMVDCMIAAVAYRHSVALFSWDIDMFRVAQVLGIELDGASLRA